MWYGKGNSHLFSLYHDYSNSLTFSNASEIFWSWISINHIQVPEENEFCHICLFTSFTKHGWLGLFTCSRAVDGKETYKKVWCMRKDFFCLVKLLLIWLSRHCCGILNFLLFTIYCDESKTVFSGQIELLLLIASQTFFWLIGSSFVSG